MSSLQEGVAISEVRKALRGIGQSGGDRSSSVTDTLMSIRHLSSNTEWAARQISRIVVYTRDKEFEV